MQIVIDSAETENGGSEIVHKISNLMPVSSAQREKPAHFYANRKNVEIETAIIAISREICKFYANEPPQKYANFPAES